MQLENDRNSKVGFILCTMTVPTLSAYCMLQDLAFSLAQQPQLLFSCSQDGSLRGWDCRTGQQIEQCAMRLLFHSTVAYHKLQPTLTSQLTLLLAQFS